MIKISDLKLNPKNPRSISKENLQKLCKSIKDFEKMMELRPMIVDENNVVLGGNMRLTALEKLGYKLIPDNWVKKAKNLNEEEKKKFLIKDNIEYGDWKEDVLKDEFDDFDLKDWDLDIDLEMSWGDGDDENQEDIIEVKPVKLKKETIVKKGDIFLLGQNKLKCGDCTNIKDVKSLMQDEKADMIFTDPPFNIGYKYNSYKDKKTSQEYYEMIKNSISNFLSDNLSIYIMQRDKNIFMQWKILSELDLNYVNLIIWKNTSQSHPKNKFQSFYQPILFFRTKEFKYEKYAEKREKPDNYWSGNNKKFKGEMNDIWDDIKPICAGCIKQKEIKKDGNSKQHPAQMPIKLPARAIKFSSDEGDIIIDMFSGSGSTLLACEQLKRKCYAIEQDPIYCQVIIDRYINLKKNKGEDVFLLKDGKKISYFEILKEKDKTL